MSLLSRRTALMALPSWATICAAQTTDATRRTNDLSGVTATSVTVGRVLPRSFVPFAGMAKQRADGADACIAYANATGGVYGRKIVVKERDDGYNAAQATREVEALINQDDVFALIGAFVSS